MDTLGSATATGAQTFNAGTIDSLSAFDKLTGNSNASTVLNANVSGTALAAGMTVTGIPTATINSTGATFSADVSGWTGLTSLTTADAGATGAVSTITAATTTNVTSTVNSTTGGALTKERSLFDCSLCIVDKGAVVTIVVLLIVVVGCKCHTHSPRRKIVYLPPDHWANIKPVVTAVHVYGLFCISVIQMDIKRAGHGNASVDAMPCVRGRLARHRPEHRRGNTLGVFRMGHAGLPRQKLGYRVDH